MPHYKSLKEEREAIEEFQILTETRVKPAIEALKQSTSQADFDTRRDALRDGNLMRDWQAMFGTFRNARETANMNAASDIAKEVADSMRAAVDYRKNLAQAAAPAAGGFKKPRKYSRKYCKKTPCRKMGFTQRSSCRPYKNCFTQNRGRRAGL